MCVWFEMLYCFFSARPNASWLVNVSPLLSVTGWSHELPVGHVEHFFLGLNEVLRLMTAQAPLHFKARIPDDGHLVDRTMARAADALVHVDLVVEVDEVR